MQGWTGNDTIIGGSGFDTLTGDLGMDRLIGGASADCYNFDDGDTGLGGQRDRSRASPCRPT